MNSITVDSGGAARLQATWRDFDLTPVAPNSIEYKVLNANTGAVVVPPTGVTPTGATTTISLMGDVLTNPSTITALELHVLVKGSFGANDAHTLHQYISVRPAEW